MHGLYHSNRGRNGGENMLNGHRARIPFEAAANQVVSVAMNYLTGNANTRHRGAAGLVARSFVNAFPRE